MPSHEALSVSPQGALEISLVVGQPPSLDRNFFSTPRMVSESHKRDESHRPSSQRPQYPTLFRRLKRRLGLALRANLFKGLWSDREIRLHIHVLELKAFFCGPSKVQGPVLKETVLVATENSTVVAYINKEEPTRWRCALSCGRSQPSLQVEPRPINNGHCIRRCSNRSVSSGSLLM